jgi:hypothetical protein
MAPSLKQTPFRMSKRTVDTDLSQLSNYKAVAHSKFYRMHISIIIAAADPTVSLMTLVQVLLLLTVYTG